VTRDGDLGFRDLVASDYARFRPGARFSWSRVVLRVPSVPGILASILVRAQQCLHRGGRTRLASSMQTLTNALCGADVTAGAHIGTGLMLVHPTGVVVGNGARIGDNVTFAGGVTLAAGHYEGEGAQCFPVVGDGVVVGAHAVLLGGIRVGDGAVIGANSVVLKDVPDGAVVVGAPAAQVGVRPPRRETADGAPALED
jgi:serine O-acetyltransferase